MSERSGDEDFDPFEINFLPQFERGRGPRQPFINEYGVVIGDYNYESPHSPLENWSKETDPAVMAGDQWVHPFKDIGFHTAENRDYFEQGISPQGAFGHPDKDSAYATNISTVDEPSDKAGEDEEGAGAS